MKINMSLEDLVYFAAELQDFQDVAISVNERLRCGENLGESVINNADLFGNVEIEFDLQQYPDGSALVEYRVKMLGANIENSASFTLNSIETHTH